MIALVYLGVMVWFGDAVARRWFVFASWPHRLASAFLVGLLLSTWLSYLIGLIAAGTSDPMAISAMGSIWLMVLAAIWLRRRAPSAAIAGRGLLRHDAREWIGVLLLFVVVGWMMTATYSLADGQLRIAGDIWSDFGPTTAIAQSFALGHNFPTEYPHFAGEPIRYHFLYYFQVGNLTYLGLDPASANNILSVPSVVAMLLVLVALGERLFASRLVGWIGAVLFFCFGALSVVPYLGSFPSLQAALAALPALDHFLSSGFPYRGEEWGIWSQDVFLNQRHLASAIGILLLIVLFVLNRLHATAGSPDDGASGPRGIGAGAILTAIRRWRDGVIHVARQPSVSVRTWLADPWLPGYVLCGLLAGLLPLYNSAIFFAAGAVLGIFFVVFPNRTRMLLVAIVAAVPAIPQVIFLRPETVPGGPVYPAIYLGYIVDNPTVERVATYLAFIFGPKLVLSTIALVAGTWEQRRVFLAFLSLVVVAFVIQLSAEVFANHKFIQTWLIVANLFAAYGIVRLWNVRHDLRWPGRLVAVGLTGVIVVGGVVDFIPIKNERLYTVGWTGDPLYDWVSTQTSPKAVFLTDLVVVHEILIAGRKVYLGWPYYAWSAGYDMPTREASYRAIFAERSPRELVARLQAAGIDYVAIDDGLRDRGEAPKVNQEVFRAHLDAVFTDPENRYAHLTIYRVPTDPGAAARLPEASPIDMYTGGAGSRPGQFNGPRGLARDPSSGDLWIADAGNGRIERYSSSGDRIGSLGGDTAPVAIPGATGVAADRAGRVFVAAGDRLLAYDASGRLLSEWSAAAGAAFSGLIDVAVDDSGRIFALDAGNGRVVSIAPDGTATAWGSVGRGEGQLQAPTGIAVGDDTIAVADEGNARIDLFDTTGNLVDQLDVPEWDGTHSGVADVALTAAGEVFATVPRSNSYVMFRADGSEGGPATPVDPDALDGPAALALQPGGALFVSNLGSNRITLLTNPRL